MKYLLDTSVYSQPLKKFPLPSVVKRWKEAGDSGCCVSIFCEMEILQGLHLSKSEKLHELYRAVLKGRVPVLDFTIREAAVYSDLQAKLLEQGKRRPVIDLCIAATALAHGCSLATLNIKDFANIPGLTIEDWSVWQEN